MDISSRRAAPTRLARNLLAGRPQKLVVYGTSLSFHLAPHLRDALSALFPGLVTVVNSGISGKASRTGLAELDKKVLAHAPDVLLLEFAVNDAHTYVHDPEGLDHGIDLRESRANLESLLDAVQTALPECEVILLTMNPAWDVPDSERPAAANRPELELYYEGYREVARYRSLVLVENFAMWRDIESADPDRFRRLIPDGVHPTPAAVREVLVPHILRRMGLATEWDGVASAG